MSKFKPGDYVRVKLHTYHYGSGWWGREGVVTEWPHRHRHSIHIIDDQRPALPLPLYEDCVVRITEEEYQECCAVYLLTQAGK